MEYIRVEQTIAALHERTPVTFAHLYTESSPLEHALHMNDYVELYVYVSGDVHYVIEDRYYELKKYDFLLIPPQETPETMVCGELLIRLLSEEKLLRVSSPLLYLPEKVNTLKTCLSRKELQRGRYRFMCGNGVTNRTKMHKL